MATVSIPVDFPLGLGLAKHDFSSDELKIALSNTAPASETNNPLEEGNGVFANITEISYSNYSDSLETDRVLDSIAWALSSGNTPAVLDFGDVVVTASGGSVADFRYIYVYNNTAANKDIIKVIDHGSTISLADTQSMNLAINSGGSIRLNT